MTEEKRRHRQHKIALLGLCVYFCPPLFDRLGRRWYPENEKGETYLGELCNADLLRKRFWRSGLGIAITIGIALLVSWGIGNPIPAVEEWLRVLAVFIALLSVLSRGGWEIQTWTADTAVERIDRAMYKAGQLGAVALLVFIMTMD